VASAAHPPRRASEERIRRMALRAGYRCTDDLKAAIKVSRKAMLAFEMKQWDQSPIARIARI
jgi:hypothetical protein